MSWSCCSSPWPRSWRRGQKCLFTICTHKHTHTSTLDRDQAKYIRSHYLVHFHPLMDSWPSRQTDGRMEWSTVRSWRRQSVPLIDFLCGALHLAASSSGSINRTGKEESESGHCYCAERCTAAAAAALALSLSWWTTSNSWRVVAVAVGPGSERSILHFVTVWHCGAELHYSPLFLLPHAASAVAAGTARTDASFEKEE